MAVLPRPQYCSPEPGSPRRRLPGLRGCSQCAKRPGTYGDDSGIKPLWRQDLQAEEVWLGCSSAPQSGGRGEELGQALDAVAAQRRSAGGEAVHQIASHGLHVRRSHCCRHWAACRRGGARQWAECGLDCEANALGAQGLARPLFSPMSHESQLARAAADYTRISPRRKPVTSGAWPWRVGGVVAVAWAQ